MLSNVSDLCKGINGFCREDLRSTSTLSLVVWALETISSKVNFTFGSALLGLCSGELMLFSFSSSFALTFSRAKPACSSFLSARSFLLLSLFSFFFLFFSFFSLLARSFSVSSVTRSGLLSPVFSFFSCLVLSFSVSCVKRSGPLSSVSCNVVCLSSTGWGGILLSWVIVFEGIIKSSGAAWNTKA